MKFFPRLLIMVSLSCSFIPFSYTGETASVSAPRQAFLDLQNAIRIKNYESAWSLISDRRRKRFHDSLEEFKLFYENAERRDASQDWTVQSETPLRDSTVALGLVNLSGVPDVSYAVKTPDSNEWKIDFPVVKLLEKVEKDMALLSKSLKKYYEKEHKFPRALSELVPKYLKALPIDTFGDVYSEADYKYKADAKGCMVYSLGPDMKDDRGRVEYSRDKGLLSNGDIILRVSP